VHGSFIENMVDAVEAAGGTVRFVELTCPTEELERRIGDASRAEFGKLRSLDLFRTLRQEGAFAYPKLPDSGLCIDTSQMSPQEAAHTICNFFSLEKHGPV
jgi:chloramphenicol 3-O-phosphotransferase